MLISPLTLHLAVPFLNDKLDRSKDDHQPTLKIWVAAPYILLLPSGETFHSSTWDK